jgi:predicted transcriptional regulator
MTKSGITQRIWLFMLEHGGRWTTAEMAEQMGGDASYMDKILWSMHDVGSITKYRSGQRKNGVAFGVSPKNSIPQGMSLQNVFKALGIRKEIDSGAIAANDSKRRAA